MHVVIHTADRFSNSFQISHHPAEIGVQPFTPRGCDNRSPIFYAENKMVMQ